MRRIAIGWILCFFALTASRSFAQQAPKKLTNGDVIAMASVGLTDDVIIDAIHAAEATDFDTSVSALKDLKAANVSDAVIRAMINPRPAANTGAPAGSPTGPATADPNDPNSPHDPGIYMYSKSRDGLRLVMLEPTVYQGSKSGGAFTSAMTYGIAKIKWKAVVQGAHADVKSSDTGMQFYFYFQESNGGPSHASFGGETAPNEFTLLKFEEKRDSRETVVMAVNAYGSSSGTDQKATIGFSFTKLRPGVYKVVPNAPLRPGEYCFLRSSGAGVYGAAAGGANRLFAFSVIPPE